MTDTEDTTTTETVSLTVEELSQLKEDYVEFCNRIADAKKILERMDALLAENAQSEVVEAWQPLKLELNHLNMMATQLNKGDYGVLVREQLESLLAETNSVYQRVLAHDQPSADVSQKANKAYNKN